MSLSVFQMFLICRFRFVLALKVQVTSKHVRLHVLIILIPFNPGTSMVNSPFIVIVIVVLNDFTSHLNFLVGVAHSFYKTVSTKHEEIAAIKATR